MKFQGIIRRSDQQPLGSDAVVLKTLFVVFERLSVESVASGPERIARWMEQGSHLPESVRLVEERKPARFLATFDHEGFEARLSFPASEVVQRISVEVTGQPRMSEPFWLRLQEATGWMLDRGPIEITEDEWQVCDDPEAMLDCLQERITERQILLFACACWRRARQFLASDPVFERSLDLAEQWGECKADPREVEQTLDETCACLSVLLKAPAGVRSIGWSCSEAAGLVAREAREQAIRVAYDARHAAVCAAWEAWEVEFGHEPLWQAACQVEKDVAREGIFSKSEPNFVADWYDYERNGRPAWGYARRTLGWDPPRGRWDTAWDAAWEATWNAGWSSAGMLRGGAFDANMWRGRLKGPLRDLVARDKEASWEAGPLDGWDYGQRYEDAEVFASFEKLAYRFERSYQTDMLRDIVGPAPFRPWPFGRLSPPIGWWAVRDAARTMFDEGCFDELPALAAALEAAGCADRELLDHCRWGGPHIRGCWAVDVLLGES